MSKLNKRISRLSVPGTKWKQLVHEGAREMVGQPPVKAEPLLTLIHLSDLHICDAQSPTRMEFVDRFADPDNPYQPLVHYIGTYRAQEFLTVQVLEAMVESVNKIETGPLLGAKVDSVIVTGDMTDNAQANELDWYKTVLDGGPVKPNSGSDEKFESFHAAENNDPHYYHPDVPGADRPQTMHDFPAFPGVTKASIAPFVAKGLKHNWLAIHGNHDSLLQGTTAPTPELEAISVGNAKLSELKPDVDLMDLFHRFSEVGPADYADLNIAFTEEVTPDPNRKFNSIPDWVDRHTNCGHDHGMSKENRNASYYYRDLPNNIRLIALDTVNANGGWQGCIDRVQWAWLVDLLANSSDKYVILTSHHPLEKIFNDYAPEGVPTPAVRKEIQELLFQYKNIILWVCGHNHQNFINQIKREDGSHAFWHIRTASHIDWPQQSRVIEIAREGSEILIGTTIVDHAGPLEFKGTESELADPIALAGFSRQLAANDWQRQEGLLDISLAEGRPEDQNVWLRSADSLKK
jgi:metallophosphoesterase (TIGR03767 family)